MISESVETIVQQKLRPGLCAVNPDKPLQYGEMAWLLPRGDAAFKVTWDACPPGPVRVSAPDVRGLFA